MTRSEIFTAAHKLAKTFIGDYRACFALALKTIYSMNNDSTSNELKEYGLYNKAVEIKTAIENGSRWNKKVYLDRQGRVNVYLDNKYKLFTQDRIDGAEIKGLLAAFLADTKQTTRSSANNFGSLNWWAAGMNGE